MLPEKPNNPNNFISLLDLKINAVHNSVYGILEFQQWIRTAKIT